MEKRTLGRTGHRSTVVTFGTFSVGRIPQGEADKVIQQFLDHGVNHIDIAPSYGEAMERLSPWMPRIRNQVFLGAKTSRRTKDDAWRDIESIVKRLGVDRFDLFQLHAVINMEQLDHVMGQGGAFEALLEMRDQGMTKWLGITGHGPDVPRTHLEALRRFDFDTIMFPVNAAMYQNPSYRKDAEELIAAARARNVGVQAIKMVARGGWGERAHDANTWYDPHREQEDIDRALWWQLSQPIDTAPSTGEPSLVPKVLDAAERFTPLDKAEQEQIIRSQRPPLPEPRLAILAAH
ncbi:MAG: aldo/keto reductase [Chloroflexi bacterium]|nr:aldo/keto reductase [Chloroflexota bacterium]